MENWIEENQINDVCVCLVELLEMILVPEKIRERERERERGESGFSFPLEEKDGDREGGVDLNSMIALCVC